MLFSHVKLQSASAASFKRIPTGSVRVWCSSSQVESQTLLMDNVVNEFVRKIVSEPGEVCIPAGANLPGIIKCTFGNLKYFNEDNKLIISLSSKCSN